MKGIAKRLEQLEQTTAGPVTINMLTPLPDGRYQDADGRAWNEAELEQRTDQGTRIIRLTWGDDQEGTL